MTSSRPGDLTTRIEQLLREGRSREEIVRELVQGGLSEAGAQRFVDRVEGRFDSSRAPGVPKGPPAESTGESGPTGPLVQGTFWLSLGSCVTVVTLLLAEPGEEYVVAYGAVAVGLFLFLRGMVRWRRSSSPFPGLAVAAAAALPILGSVAVVAFVSHRRTRLREAQEAVRVEREQAALAEQTRREEEEKLARRQAAAAAQKRRLAEREEARVQDELERLRSDNAMRVCSGAKALARMEVREAVPELESLLHDENNVVKNCAAEALVGLGEVDTALAAYVEWAGSDNSFLRAAAVRGFGMIGPPAAAVSLPYLQEALGSADARTRYGAVAALSEMGDAAEPLLRMAANDPETSVSGRAETALKDLER
jgi:hypothetical protein